MIRRTFFAAIAALTLTGCSGSVQTDTQLISAGIDLAVPALLAADPKDSALITRAGTDAKAALVALAAPGDKASAADRLSASLDTLAGIAATYLPAGSPYAATIPAAVKLAELVIAQATGRAQAARVASGMSVERARVILKSR